MIKFFRKIRQKLLAQNKFTKYIVYAAGEILLVVIGILIALQINNWNEQRKTEIDRQKLIATLIEDFEYTQKDILSDELPYISRLQENMDSFLYFSKEKESDVSVDSLRILAISFFRYNHFNPNLTSYNQAVSSGSISLLNNSALMNQFTKFKQYLNSFKDQENQSRFSYYNGAFWEFRKTLNSSVFYGQTPSNISFEDYQSIINTPSSK